MTDTFAESLPTLLRLIQEGVNSSRMHYPVHKVIEAAKEFPRDGSATNSPNDPNSAKRVSTAEQDEQAERGKLKSHRDRDTSPTMCDTCRAAFTNGRRLGGCSESGIIGTYRNSNVWYDEEYCLKDWRNFGMDPETERFGILFYDWKSRARSCAFFWGPLTAHAVEFALIPPEDHRSSTLGSTTGSESSFNLALSWIQGCSHNHQLCKPPMSNDFLPTRLLDVGTSHNDVIRVLERDEIPRGSRYVTLSHCWGEKQLICLTTDTFHRYKGHIPSNELSRTFSDAVDVTRRLSIRYIWIDSLCIIQNSREDWAAESLTMRDVYENSFCNIAATSGRDGSAGCYQERIPSLLEECPVFVSHQSFTGLYYLRHETVWIDRLKQSPLLQRAWVLQERMLAPRTLHFAQEQLVWECTELTACEQYPNGLDHETRFGVTKTDKRLLSTVGPTTERIEAVETWDSMLSAYTSCQLTKETDKFIALSGIALKFSSFFKGGYLAGLWVESFNADLLWVTHGQAKRVEDPYVAPSWSWAAIRGQVYHRRHSLNRIPKKWSPMEQKCSSCMNILNFEHLVSRFSSCNAFTEPLKLRVRCHLLGMVWPIKDGPVTIVNDFHIVTKNGKGWKFTNYPGGGELSIDVHEPGEDKRLLWFMPVLVLGTSLSGLILEYVKEESCFRRAGVMSHIDWKAQIIDGFRQSDFFLPKLKNGNVKMQGQGDENQADGKEKSCGIEFMVCDVKHLHEITII
ncbi:heterokaryon incompatibility protein-domain-containing protein [Xylaria digitata]|nr:heterokaryon incompatibility protein-domain-containing protein [Xylaria digitata]